jgi:hypothetical protein
LHIEVTGGYSAAVHRFFHYGCGVAPLLVSRLVNGELVHA